MSVLDKLRTKTNPVARRRRVSAIRSWITYSPSRARAVILTIEVVLAVAVIGGVLRATIWVQDSKFQADQVTYEQSLTTPTDGSVVVPQPLVPDPAATTSATNVMPPKADPTAEATAVRFVNLWLAGRTAKSQAAWINQLRPVVAPGQLAIYNTVGRSRIPNTKVKNVTSTLLIDGKAYSTINLTNGVTVLATLTGSSQNWAVAEFTDVQAD